MFLPWWINFRISRPVAFDLSKKTTFRSMAKKMYNSGGGGLHPPNDKSGSFLTPSDIYPFYFFIVLLLFPLKIVIVICRFLATGTTYKHLAHEFRIGCSTVSDIVKEICIIIWEKLVEDYMPVPTQQQLQIVIEEYNTLWNFPNYFGSIDGKHC